MRSMLPLLAALLVPAGTLLACNVPVFRYALERWRPDPFEVIVQHDGPLTEAELEAVRFLETNEDASGNPPAFVVRRVDVRRQRLSPFRQPAWLSVRVSYRRRLTEVWTGPLTQENARRIVVSKIRQKLQFRLISGESAVWLLVECGDRARDAAALRVLQQQTLWLTPAHAWGMTGAELLGMLPVGLPALTALAPGRPPEAKIPELTDDPEDQLQLGPPLRICFSLLRLRADDPEEAILVRALLAAEPDLLEEGEKEPLAFLVFGRGRSLPALAGAGINVDNVRQHTLGLLAACKCTDKNLAGGFDLPLVADWVRLLEEATPKRTEPPRDDSPATNWLRRQTTLEATAVDPDGSRPRPASGEDQTSEPRVQVLLLGISLLILLAGGVVASQWARRARPGERRR